MYKSIQVRLKRYKQNKSNQQGVFKYFGNNVFFPTDSLIYKMYADKGSYEKENIEILKGFLTKESCVFDVGANIGLISMALLATHHYKKIVAVEASPNTLNYLKKTHSQHADKDNWIIIDKAVSDKPGKIQFNVAESHNGAYDSIHNTGRTQFTNTIEVESDTIDNIWSTLGKPDVSLIKIDIEGAEMLALKGAENCIQKCKPALFIEWNENNFGVFGYKNIDLLQYAEKNQYKIYAAPYLNSVTDETDLSLYNVFNEYYLLIPINK